MIRKTHALFIAMLLILCLNCINPFLSKTKKDLTETAQADYTAIKQRVNLLMSEENYPAAAQALDSLNAILPDAWNYLQLGKLARLQEKWYEAESYLNKAKDMKYHYAEACYELGRVYDDGPFSMIDAYALYGWTVKYNPDFLDAYYRKARIRMIDRGWEHGLKELEPLIVRDPSYEDCYSLYGAIGSAYHLYHTQAGFYRKLLFLYPDSVTYLNDFVEAMYHAGDYPAAYDTLESYQENLFEMAPALYYLQKSRILLALKRDPEAWEAYSLGIEKIKTGSEADEFFQDISYITTEEEYDHYFSSDVLKKKKFLRIFWKSRDPTLTTEFNERFVEHYERLRYVLKYNRRYPENRLFKFLMIPGNKAEPHGLMKKFGQSTGSGYQCLIDDLGIIYLRHGKPDKFYTVINGFNLSWHYPARGDRDEMIFHFERPRKSLEDFGESLTNLGWILTPKAVYAEQGSWVEHVKPGSVFNSIITGTSTTTTDYKPAKPLNYLSDYYIFRGDSAEKIFLYYTVPNDLDKSRSESVFLLKQEAVLFNGAWVETARFGNADTELSLRTNSGEDIIRKFTIPVHPGRYFIGLHLGNSGDGSAGDRRFMVDVPDSRRGSLGMSRIMLANLESNKHIFTDDESRSRADAILPSLSRTFKQYEPIAVYFELYNLLTDQHGRSHATVSLRVEQKKINKSRIAQFFTSKDEPVSVTLEHTLRGRSDREYYLQSISLPAYLPGEYELEIRVKDNHVSTTLVRSIRFTIVK